MFDCNKGLLVLKSALHGPIVVSAIVLNILESPSPAGALSLRDSRELS